MLRDLFRPPPVFAVPRGGLTVADPIADALDLPLDVWVTGQGRSATAEPSRSRSSAASIIATGVP